MDNFKANVFRLYFIHHKSSFNFLPFPFNHLQNTVLLPQIAKPTVFEHLRESVETFRRKARNLRSERGAARRVGKPPKAAREVRAATKAR